MTNVRRYARATVSLETRVRVFDGGTFTSLRGRIVVLGAGGAFVELSEDVPIGTRLGLHFTLPSAPDPVICRAVVRSGLPGQGVGVEFLQLSSRDAERVAQLIEQVLGHARD
jgi:hypothetical protein